MRRVICAISVLALLSVVTTSVQSKPDFSGKWTAVASTGGGTGEPLTVVQDAATITISSPSDRGGPVSLKLDGSPGKYPQFLGDGKMQEREAKAEWSGTKLVVTHKAYSNGFGDYTIKMTWSRDGERLAIETVMTRDANGAPIASGTATYRKQ